MKEILDDIIFAEYNFNFNVKEASILPAFKGSLIRGAFGAELRHICCIYPKLKTCLNCAVNDVCVYANTFESVNSRININKDKFLGHSTHLPHPFVIKETSGYKTYYCEGDLFNFKLILIGKEFISKIPYYIFAFKKVFEKGVKTNKKTSMELKSVILNIQNQEYYEIYNSKTGNVDPLYKDKFNNSRDILKENFYSNRLTIEFLTPTRIGNEINENKIDFKTFVKAILRRLCGIASIYFNKDAKIDAKEYLKETEEIVIKDYATEIYNFYRVSKRQGNKKIDMKGIRGIIKYFGNNIDKYLPLIKLGEYFHIGKWTGFGMGEYKIKEY